MTNSPIPAALVERMRATAEVVWADMNYSDKARLVVIAEALAHAFLDGQREQLEMDVNSVCAFCAEVNAPKQDARGWWLHYMKDGTCVSCDADEIRRAAAERRE